MSYAVAVYLVDRAYGGPEEGGWYYDTHELSRDPALVSLTRVYNRLHDAADYANRLNEGVLAELNEGRPEIWSVNSYGQFEAIWFDMDENPVLPPYMPERRPHYE